MGHRRGVVYEQKVVTLAALLRRIFNAATAIKDHPNAVMRATVPSHDVH
jgi:hypothetical protein